MPNTKSNPRRTAIKRRWRDYRTPAGKRPVKEFIDGLARVDAASVTAAMKEVQISGLKAARHLRRDIYEVRAEGKQQTFRLLFAQEGSKGRILLALEAISKKTQKTPAKTIELAQRRLGDWRRRGSGRSKERRWELTISR